MQLHPQFNFQKNETLIVAISGGADSVALVHLLLENGYQNLLLCHINHQLRGEESNQDQRFVEILAQEKNLPLEIFHHSITEISEKKQTSLELTARNARHESFAQLYEKHGFSNNHKPILLAHHADDVVETTLLNLIRGSAGLKGINYHSAVNSTTSDSLNKTTHTQTIQLYRPLLLHRKQDLINYLKERNLSWREDVSNKANFTPRNTLRNNLIPQLEQLLQRDVSKNIIKALRHQEEINQAINETLDLLDFLDPQGRLFLPKLTDQPKAFQKHLLTQFLQQKNISGISQDMLNQAHYILNTTEKPASLNLPGNNKLTRRQQRGFIEKQKTS